ncbi:MAG: DUF554 domain-containing protein [Selenomonas sp.]|nr:DUF554 domain-containing protein [Selenomonas sp.]
MLFRRGIPKHISAAIMQALGICTVVIGAQGAVAEPDILIMIVSAVVGVFIGEWLDLDGRINRFTERLTSRFAGGGEGARIANAFITSCLIMNVGAMVIVGSLNAGLRADFAMLYTKSLLDFIAGIMMAAVMGIGVMGSGIFTLFFQGGIVLLAQYIAPFLSDQLVTEVSCTGSLLILALGLNMLEVTKIKVLNYLPALAVVPVVVTLMSLWQR